MSGIKIGSAARIEIGIAGESGTREIVFDAAQWMEKYPECEAAIVGVRADGEEFTAPDVKEDRSAKTIIWTPTEAETIEGEGEAQILWMDGKRVAKKAVMVTVCHRALETDATVPDAPEPTWAQKAIEAKQEAQEAAARAEAAQGTIESEKEAAMEEINNAVQMAQSAAETATQQNQAAQSAATTAETQSQAAQNAATQAQNDAAQAQRWAATAQTYATETQQAQAHAQGYAQAAQTAGEKAATEARAAEAAEESANAAAKAANEAAANVKDGGYYTPSVANDGRLFWEPSEADMPIPDSVNIRGPQGAPGETPTVTSSKTDGVTTVKFETSTNFHMFQIKDGETGPKGDTGPKGEPGSPLIIPTEEGDVIALSDSADRALRRIEIFGRTTQNGTPTPDAPVELESVGADGNVKVVSAGRNLAALEPRLESNLGVTSSYNASTGVITLKGTATGNAFLSYWLKEPIPAGVPLVFGMGNDVADGNVSIRAQSETDAKNTTISTLNEKNKITNAALAHSFEFVVMRIASGATVDMTLKIGIMVGGSAADYAYSMPNTPNSATITTANGLPGVPVTSGGNYTDANGQQWIADTIEYDADAGTAKRVQRVWYGRITSTSHQWMTSSSLTGRYIIAEPTPAMAIAVAPMCTAFRGQIGTTEEVNVAYAVYGTRICFNTPYATLDEWKAYLDANEIDLVYGLATPIETDLSADDLASLAALRTHYPNTTIYNDDGAHMAARYVADTKNYIDQKIQSIAAAMINNI